MQMQPSLHIRLPQAAPAAAATASLGEVAAPGTFDADYELDVSARELGRGAFSTVRACTHRASGERRAAKIIDMRRFRLAQNFRASTLLDEVRLLRSMCHPSIIRVFEVYDATQPADAPTPAARNSAIPADSIVIVTELAPGGELFESIIAAGNFSEPQACHVVWQVLRALELLHERDIVHRDVKPENLLVVGTDFVSVRDPVVRPGYVYPQSAAKAMATSLRDVPAVTASSMASIKAMSAPPAVPMLRVKLADFGVARYVGGSTLAAGASTFVGSPQYMAPEVLLLLAGGARSGGARRRSYGCAVDVYSLGVVLYVMLAGYLPFDESGASSTEAKQHLRRLQEEVGGGEPLTWEDRVRLGAFYFAPPVWTHISENAKAVIRGMMVTDPDARLTVQQVMALPWFDAVRGADEGDSPASEVDSRSSPSSRSVGGSGSRSGGTRSAGGSGFEGINSDSQSPTSAPLSIPSPRLSDLTRILAQRLDTPAASASSRTIANFFLMHGRSLEALRLAGSTGVAAALARMPLLLPQVLSDAFAAGLEGTAADPASVPPRVLLELARGALDVLNAASRAGGAEASAFLEAALRAGLYAHVFADERAAFATMALDLSEASVAAYERKCKRVTKTITRTARWGESTKTLYTLPDGTPLVSFVHFRPDDETLVESFLQTVEADPFPSRLFGLYADTSLRPGEVPRSADAAIRARLGERAAAAGSSVLIAAITVSTENTVRGNLSAANMARLFATGSALSVTPREFEGLFLTFGRHKIGIVALSVLSTLACASPAFEFMLDPRVDGFARVLGTLSSTSSDVSDIEGCLMTLAAACRGGERFGQALVDKQAFTLLQPVILHKNAVLALRAAFAVACIATSCKGADEALHGSGVLDVITRVLRPFSIGSIVIPGFFSLTKQVAETILQPGVAPALQLAALHRLGASISGPESTANVDSLKAAPMLAALRTCAASPDAFVAAAAAAILSGLLVASDEADGVAPDPAWLDQRPEASAAMRAASGLLVNHGRSLEALRLAGSTGVAAALARMPLLLPQVLSDAFAAGLEGTAADPASVPPRVLLELARGALDVLNAASRAGGAEASAFLEAALRAGLYAHIFADERAAFAAVALDLCEASVSAYERVCERAGLTVTRPVPAGEVVRTIISLADGAPLHSFVILKPGGDAFLSSFVRAFSAAPFPTAAFRIFANTRLHADGAPHDSGVAVVREQLGDRALGAASRAYIASLTVLTHSVALGALPPSELVRLRAVATGTSLSLREFEGLFLTFGRDHIGVALIFLAAVLPASSLLEDFLSPRIDGLTHLLRSMSSPLLDDLSIVGCVIFLSHACAHSERVALDLVDRDVFVLLQPAILRSSVAIAVRAAFAVASIAVGCRGADDRLCSSGVLEVIANRLRTATVGSVALPGYLNIVVPTALRLLKPGVHPALQLAALHRLGACFSDPQMAAAADAAMKAPLVSAVRDCAASRDAFVYSAAVYVLKELKEPLPLFCAASVADALEAQPPLPPSFTATMQRGPGVRLAPLSGSSSSAASSAGRWGAGAGMGAAPFLVALADSSSRRLGLGPLSPLAAADVDGGSAAAAADTAALSPRDQARSALPGGRVPGEWR